MRRLALIVLIGCADQVTPPRAAVRPPPTIETHDLQAPDIDAPTAAPPIDRFATRTLGVIDDRPHYTGRPISLDLKDADVANVCRLIADVGNVNIVLGDGVQGQVTLTMHRVPWDHALDSVLRAKGLRAERDGNVILVFAK